MSNDMESALQIIKNSGLVQATKIKALEEANKNLASMLKETMATNAAMNAEIQGLTRNLQAKTAIIDAMHQNFANCLKANADLDVQFLGAEADDAEERKCYTQEQLRLLAKAPPSLLAPNASLPVGIQIGQSNKAQIYAKEWKKVDATATEFRALLDAVKRKNVDVLAAKAADLEIDNCYQAKKCIVQVFEKAIAKPIFCEVYAEFCQKICETKESFKKLLIVGCREFVKIVTAETMVIVRFIEQLVGNLLDMDILMQCVVFLLRCGVKTALILLCDILEKHGMHLQMFGGQEFIDIFAKLVAIGADPQVSQKVCLAIQRLTALKLNGWAPVSYVNEVQIVAPNSPNRSQMEKLTPKLQVSSNWSQFLNPFHLKMALNNQNQ